jgi:hypothetical protein
MMAMLMVRDTNDFIHQMMGDPYDSKKGQKKIQDAGIDTKSKAYQVVISDMAASAGAGMAYTNPTAIKNRMMNYDANGNWVNPAVKYYGAKSNGKVFNAGKVEPDAK